MSQSWPKVTLADVCHFIVDSEHKTAPTQDDGYPMIRTPNIGRGYFLLDGVRRVSEETYRGWTKRAVPRTGDLILAREAPVGNVAMVKEGMQVCLGQRTVLIRPNEQKVDPAYLTYLLLGDEVQGHFHSVSNGATVHHLNLKDLRVLQLPTLPPLATQRKIASILSAYDDLIENNTRRVRVLEDMARALYREWFVEYRFPGHEQAEFVEDEQGRRPKEWAWVPVGDVALVHRGRSYKKENLVENGGMPFINLKCIERDGGFRMDGIKRYDGPIKPSQTVTADDIVMGVTDMTQERRIVARAARIPRLTEPAAVSMDLVKIQPRADVAGSYLYGMFRFSDFADEIKLHANGANVLHLSPDRITS